MYIHIYAYMLKARVILYLKTIVRHTCTPVCLMCTYCRLSDVD